MASVPRKIATRISAWIKKISSNFGKREEKDIGESDTVKLIVSILEEIFGYDKFNEITSEQEIRGSYCDLAVKIDGKMAFLVEAKAIGQELKESHLRQAVNYAANHDCDWVVLTNSIEWHIYRVADIKPIEEELVLKFVLSDFSHRKKEHIETLSLLVREAWKKSRLDNYAEQKQTLSKFTIAAILLSESSLQRIRGDMRRICKGSKVSTKEIETVMVQEVIKRELLEGDKAESAKKLVSRKTRRKPKAVIPAAVTHSPKPGVVSQK